jgi:hypothetical protein
MKKKKEKKEKKGQDQEKKKQNADELAMDDLDKISGGYEPGRGRDSKKPGPNYRRENP